MTSPLLPAPREDYRVASPMEDDATPASPLPIRRLLSFLLKFWWVPVITLLLSVGAAVAYLWRQPPTFISKASMWETVKLRLPEGATFSEDLQSFMGTQTELLQSKRLEQLALDHYKTISTNPIPRNQAGQLLPERIRVIPAPKSSVFALELTSSDPTFAQQYLGSLMQVYMDYKKNIRKVVSGDTLASISEQVLRLERDLKVEQDNLTAFQRSNNLAILQEEGTIAGGYLARLNTQLSDCRLEARLQEAAALEQESARNTNAPTGTNASGGSRLFNSPFGATSSSLSGADRLESQNAFREVEMLKLQRERLSRYLKPKHPKIVKLDADLERFQKLIELIRNQNRDQLAASRQSLQMRMEGIQGSIKEWQGKVSEANNRIAEADRLKLNVHRIQSVYDRLLMLLQSVDISRNIDQETLAVLETASPAQRSYKQEFMVLALACCGGLGAGLGIVLILAWRDDRFTSIIEVNAKLGDAVVGQVPEVRPERRNSRVPLLEVGDPRQMYAESYRNLRSAICYMAVEGERPRVLLITSASPDEGKSTIAANLARTLALGGSRVLLVDGDMRKGLLHEAMGLPSTPGLADVLREPADLEKAIQSNGVPNLSFIARGSDVQDPGDLLQGPIVNQLLDRFRQQFDYVVIDSCPIFAADDTTTLASKVDGTLFVVRSSFSRAGAVREALGLLFQRQAKVLGVVFNRADASARSYYYYKHTDYYRSAKAV